MKKMAILLSSGIALLSANLLMAQSAVYSTDSARGGSSHAYYPSNYHSAPSHASNQIHWLRSYSDAVALSQSTSKPIAILFTGTGWCPACMKLERQVLTKPEFAQAVSQRFVFLKAEFPDYSEQAVMASPYKVLIDRYRINAFPTIVVINANGQQLFTVNYQEGGPQAYAQELLKKLNQIGSANPQNFNQF